MWDDAKRSNGAHGVEPTSSVLPAIWGKDSPGGCGTSDNSTLEDQRHRDGAGSSAELPQFESVTLHADHKRDRRAIDHTELAHPVSNAVIFSNFSRVRRS